MEIAPIATVRSCFGGKFGVPRQPGLCPAAWGELVFDEKFRSPEAVRGIEGFSHLWLVFGFHETVAEGWRPTVRPPRLGGDERVGVFASRSTYRPNGLGLSLVKLEGVDLESGSAPVLKLGGLDLVDGTPIYDIKPYLAYAESVPNALCGYASSEPARIPVTIDAAALDDFQKLPERARTLILEALALDPRPATTMTKAEDESRVFGADLCGCNVRFTIAAGICRLVEIDRAGGSGLNG
jgi:tRNA-Thr(GGU) m(6)t(6)A37 methyltransferase TsaA